MILRKAITLSLLSISMTLISCLSVSSQQPVPALLDRPSPETRKALEKAIGSLINSDPIKLSDKAFTKKNTLIIDQINSHLNQSLLNGRELRKADSFSLLKEKDQCIVRHNQTNKIIFVDKINCSVL